jgi:hypothetical protein
LSAALHANIGQKRGPANANTARPPIRDVAKVGEGYPGQFANDLIPCYLSAFLSQLQETFDFPRNLNIPQQSRGSTFGNMASSLVASTFVGGCGVEVYQILERKEAVLRSELLSAAGHARMLRASVLLPLERLRPGFDQFDGPSVLRQAGVAQGGGTACFGGRPAWTIFLP